MLLMKSGLRLVPSVGIMDLSKESTGARVVNILFLQGAFNPIKKSNLPQPYLAGKCGSN